jgi:hypothetical protein
MTVSSLFPLEDLATNHPGDARHWAESYAEIVRTVLVRSTDPGTWRTLLERLEVGEDRYRLLSKEAASLMVKPYCSRPLRFRALPRTAPMDTTAF